MAMSSTLQSSYQKLLPENHSIQYNTIYLTINQDQFYHLHQQCQAQEVYKKLYFILSTSYTHPSIHHPHWCHGQIREKRCDLVAFCFNAAAAAEGRRHTSLRRRHTLPSQS